MHATKKKVNPPNHLNGSGVLAKYLIRTRSFLFDFDLANLSALLGVFLVMMKNVFVPVKSVNHFQEF